MKLDNDNDLFIRSVGEYILHGTLDSCDYFENGSGGGVMKSNSVQPQQ